MDARFAAQFLASQVAMARALGEQQYALDCAETACDLFDDPAYERLLADLKRP